MSSKNIEKFKDWHKTFSETKHGINKESKSPPKLIFRTYVSFLTGPVDADTVKIIWIKNTSKLGEMWISQGLMNEAKKNKAIRILGDECPMQFDGARNLYSLPLRAKT